MYIQLTINPHPSVLQSVKNAFDGNKPAKCVFLKDNRIFAVGFMRMGGRQYGLWDAVSRNLRVKTTTV